MCADLLIAWVAVEAPWVTLGGPWALGLGVSCACLALLAVRRSRLCWGGLLTSPVIVLSLVGLIEGVTGYAAGSARLWYCSCWEADHDANLDRSTRAWWTRFECAHGEGRWMNPARNLALRVLARILGPPAEAYRGPYPTAEEATDIVRRCGREADTENLWTRTWDAGRRRTALPSDLLSDPFLLVVRLRSARIAPLWRSSLVMQVEYEALPVLSFSTCCGDGRRGALVVQELLVVDLGSARVFARFPLPLDGGARCGDRRRR